MIKAVTFRLFLVIFTLLVAAGCARSPQPLASPQPVPMRSPTSLPQNATGAIKPNQEISTMTPSLSNLAGQSPTLDTCAQILGSIKPLTTPKPRVVPTKPAHTAIGAGYSRMLVTVKFVEGSGVRLRQGKLSSLNNYEVGLLNTTLEQYPIARIERAFGSPEAELDRERCEGQLKSGQQLADLNLYFHIVLAEGTNTSALVDSLNALAIVEIAYPEPIAEPPGAPAIP